MESSALSMSIVSACLNISPLQKHEGPFSLAAGWELWDLLLSPHFSSTTCRPLAT